MVQKAPVHTADTANETLAELLRRKDVWRGHSHAFIQHSAIDSGYGQVNAALLHKGWPSACLIECLLPSFTAVWHLCGPTLRAMSKQGLVVFLNPPAEPYSVALLQQGVDLDAVIVVKPQTKADFIASFTELARSDACKMLMAWQPEEALAYTELRKCQLATLEAQSLSFLFRHHSVSKQNSPAALRIRLSVHARFLALEFLKQKGKLPGDVVRLDLPDHWFSLESYKHLEQSSDLPLCQQDLSTPWVVEKNVQKTNTDSLVNLKNYRLQVASRSVRGR